MDCSDGAAKSSECPCSGLGRAAPLSLGGPVLSMLASSRLADMSGNLKIEVKIEMPSFVALVRQTTYALRV
jgi:hypothetical protein